MKSFDDIQRKIVVDGYTDDMFNKEKSAHLELQRAMQFQEEF